MDICGSQSALMNARPDTEGAVGSAVTLLEQRLDALEVVTRNLKAKLELVLRPERAGRLKDSGSETCAVTEGPPLANRLGGSIGRVDHLGSMLAGLIDQIDL